MDDVSKFAQEVVKNVRDILENMDHEHIGEEDSWKLLRELSEISNEVNDFLLEKTGGLINNFIDQVEQAEKGGRLEELDVFPIEDNQ